jgi:hypothetical protein
MKTLTETLSRLEASAKAACPGPWVVRHRQKFAKVWQLIKDPIKGDGITGLPTHTDSADGIITWTKNAEHIANADPSTVLKLCEAMREAMGALEYFVETSASCSKAENTLAKIEKMFEETNKEKT